MRTIYKVLNTAIIFMFVNYSLIAQTDCYTGNIPPPPQPIQPSTCSDFLNYIPTSNSQTIIFRLVYHYFNDPGNTGSPFSLAADWPLIQQQIAAMNSMLANLQPPTLYNALAYPIPDAKIKFVLDQSDVYYHADAAYWPSTQNSCQSNVLNTYGVDINRKLNVFWYWDNDENGGCGPSTHINMMTSDQTQLMNFFSWASSQVLLHEIGHSLGYLAHTMGSAQFPDITPDTQWGWMQCNNTTCGNNVMGYNICRNHLSPNQLGYWHYKAYSEVTTKFLTACDYNSLNSVIINANETWTTSKIIGGDLTVKAGKTLTVKCNVYMPKMGKVIVEPNARLIVDGGRFTNGCGEYWEGIEVWGSKAKNQYPINQPAYQGKIELKNGAILENANCAVSLWKPSDYASSGGVIVSKDAIFKNNKRSVEFISYHNTLPVTGAPTRNLSEFTNTTFSVNNNYRIPTSVFYAHVTLWDVEGVPFTACTFNNLQSNVVYQANSNIGIFSIDAGYSVSSSCDVIPPMGSPCPAQNLHQSSFSGFSYGIRAQSGAAKNSFSVDLALFDKNAVGIEIDGVNNCSVTRSNFEVGSNTSTNGPPYQIGINTISASGYRIDENTFYPPAVAGITSVGCKITNSGINYNETYNNTFKQLYFAQWALGINRNGSNAFEGLQFLCNDHNNSSIKDIMVTIYNPNGTNDGVRVYQGEPNPMNSAGNTFSQNGNDPAGDFSNYTNWPIIYYHDGGTTQPIYYSTGVIPTLSTTANRCPTRFNNGHQRIALNQDQKDELNEIFIANRSAYNDILYTYSQLIDGGNTPAVLQEIMASWPQDAWELRNMLMSRSPYLSFDVLMGASKKGILPNAMILELCLANPEGSMNAELVNYLQYEKTNPLSQSMIDLIVANWKEKSSRSLLESALSKYNAAYSTASDFLIADQTLSEDQDDSHILEYLKQRNSLADNYQISDIYISDDDYSLTKETVEAIPNKFEINDQEKEEYDLYSSYLQFRESLYHDGRSISQLTNDEYNKLKEIASQNSQRTSVLAQNILCFFNGDCRDYFDNIPASRYGNIINSASIDKNNGNSYVKVNPNPCSTYADFSIQSPQIPVNASIQIKELTGKVIYVQKIQSLQTTYKVDISKLNGGVYLFEVINDNAFIDSGKLLIQN